MDVLIVDDNAINREFLVGALRDVTEQLATAANAEQALHACEQVRFEVVFMDIHMPHTDGFAVTRSIRRRWPEPPPVIIGLTADAHLIQSSRPEEHGLQAWLAKPASIEAIERCLRELGNPGLQRAHSGAAVHPTLSSRLLQLFVAELEQKMPAILSSPTQARASELHKLRGSAAVCGARELDQALEALEVALNKADADAIRNATSLTRAAWSQLARQRHI